MKVPSNIDELGAMLRRAEDGVAVRGLTAPRSKLEASLLLRSADLSRTLSTLGGLALRMPDPWLTAARRLARRPLGGDGAGVAAAGDEAAERAQTYAEIARTAALGATKGIGFRLLIFALEWQMLREALIQVVAILEDPQTTQDERAQVREAFSGLLLLREELLLSAVERRLLRERIGPEIEARCQEREDALLLSDTVQAISMKLPVDQDTLRRAAEVYERTQGGGRTPKATG